MKENEIFGCFIAIIGLLTFCGALFEWGFFMNSPKSLFMARMMGRSRYRALNMVLGSVAAIMGTLIGLGIFNKL